MVHIYTIKLAIKLVYADKLNLFIIGGKKLKCKRLEVSDLVEPCDF